MYRILVCDDEKDIVSAIRIYLMSEGYEVIEAYDGTQAVEIAGAGKADLVLMDIMMPVMDGITAMVRIREKTNIPIILLTAKSQDTDKVLGLNVGADDYITKPFNPVELIARVRASLRRYMSLGGSNSDHVEETDNSASAVYRIGNLELDDRTKIVRVNDQEIMLTRTEYDILRLFVTNPGTVYSPREIYKKVWEEELIGSDNTVAVHIRHLREKIETDPANPRHLKVVWGRGYKMEK